MKSALVLLTDPRQWEALRECLSEGYRVTLVEAGAALPTGRYDFVIAGIMAMTSGRTPQLPVEVAASVRALRRQYPSSQLVVAGPLERMREIVNAVRAGASNYFMLPIDPEEVKLTLGGVEQTVLLESELHYLRDTLWSGADEELDHSLAPAMQEVLSQVRMVAPTRSTVLLQGETGTGKGVLARLIHRLSQRPDKQFIAVHCGAIPETLLESELFGYEKGAFTGAARRKLGKFEIAAGGTIFLDEIGTVSPATQIKLLQVLQEQSIQRVGGEEPLKIDVRIIAASNEDLAGLCDAGKFRRDLYYRLNVFPVTVPPLRQRREDLPLLVRHFLKRMNRFSLKNITDVDPRVLAAFEHYGWPGNIRELENLLERAYILEPSTTLGPAGFPKEMLVDQQLGRLVLPVAAGTLAEARRQAVGLVERQYLHELLARHRGRIALAAAAAGISPRQLRNLLHEHGLRKEAYKGKAVVVLPESK
jgi:DNA-binding NtrC family response regulator